MLDFIIGMIFLVISLMLMIWGVVKFFSSRQRIRNQVPTVIWTLICLVLTTVVVVKFIAPMVGNIPWGIVGLIALTAAVVALIAWLLWSPTRRGYTGAAVQSRWFWWPVALILLVITGFAVVDSYQKEKAAAQARAQAERQALIDSGRFPCPFDFTLRVTKEWSKTVERPAGCHFTVGRRAPVGYEMAAETKTGSLLARSMPGQTIRQHLPFVISFRLRVVEEEDENEVDVMISLYRPR